MVDTQLPAYVVFQQDRPDEPHQHAGSVHAPDAEMALMNARDVFVRRPECSSLWVARAERVFARTVEELADPAWERQGEHPQQEEREPYLVFQKLEHKGACTYVGKVDGINPQEALMAARETFENPKALVWWVLRERDVHRSAEGDVGTLFAPAEDKDFRQTTFFRTFTKKRQLRSHSQGDRDEG